MVDISRGGPTYTFLGPSAQAQEPVIRSVQSEAAWLSTAFAFFFAQTY